MGIAIEKVCELDETMFKIEHRPLEATAAGGCAISILPS